MCIKITLTLWIHFWIYYLTLQCEDDWIRNGDSCYFFSNDPRNRSGASTFCKDHGGLLVIDSNGTIHKFLLSKKINSTNYWIGLKRSSKYSWTSPISPVLPKLDNLDGNGTCIVMQDMQLKYTGCTEEHMIICQRVKNSEESDNCEGNWKFYSGYCYKTGYHRTSNYMDANGICWYNDNSHVLTSVDLPVLEFIVTTLLQSFESKSFWLGLSRYVWDDLYTPLHWQQWHGKIEMGTKDCVTFLGSNWVENNCSETNRFICQREPGEHRTNRPSTTFIPATSTHNQDEYTHESSSPSAYIENDISTTMYAHTTDSVIFVTTPSESFRTTLEYKSFTTPSVSISTQLVPVTDKSVLQNNWIPGPALIGGAVGAIIVLILIVVIAVLCYRRSKRISHKANKGDYDASYEIAFSPNTEDKTRNSDSSLTDDEKLAQLHNRDSRVIIESNIPDSEKIKPYLVTTIVDGHSEAQPSRRSKVVSSIEDRVEYDNNNLDDLIVTDNDLYHSSGSDPNTSDGRPRSTDYDYAVRPPNSNQLSQGNVFINNAYDGEAAGGAVNDIQGAQIHYADIAFCTETLNKENTYADIDDFAPHHGESDVNVPTTAGVAPSENKPSNANNETDSDNQVGKMKAIPVYAEVDANKMDKNKNEIIDDRKDAQDLEEGVNDLIVTDNDLYDFDN